MTDHPQPAAPPMPENRYSTAQLLTMTTGKLVCQLGDLYAIASELLGRSVYTHELPAAFRECKPWILAHVPQLDGITGDEVSRDNWQEWIAARIAELGDGFTVPPLTDSATAKKSPLETLQDAVGDKPIIVVETDSR